MARKTQIGDGKGAGGRRAGLRGQAAREAILDAAVEEIVRAGIDRLGALPTADRAGLTTGAIYSRWESLDDLLVDVWLDRIRTPLSELMETSLQVAREPSGNLAVQLSRELNGRQPLFDAATDFLLVARRHEILAEVILPEVAAWFDTPTARLLGHERTFLVLSTVVGHLIHRIVCEPEAYDWPTLLEIIALSAPVKGPVPKVPLPNPGADLPDEGEPDSTRQKLVRAAAAVIARTGLARATVSRIGRRAGVDRTLLYQHYEGVTELLIDAARTQVKGRLRADSKFLTEVWGKPNSAPLSAALSLHVMTAPQREEWRNLRSEVHLAARIHGELFHTLAGSLEAGTELARMRLRSFDPKSNHLIGEASHVYRSLIFGMSLLWNGLKCEADLARLQEILAGIYATIERRIQKGLAEALRQALPD